MAEARKNKMVRSENAPTFYVNNVEIRGTQFDFRISLGEVTDVTDGQMVIKHLADIYMSPQHAKSVLKLLEGQLKKWEEKVGPIALVEEETK